MSATVEAPRSRAGLLARTLEEREEEKANLLSRIAGYVREEETERVKALQKSPTERTDRMGSPVAEARGKRVKAEARLATLEPEIVAVRDALRIAAREEAIETIEQAASRSEAFREAELDVYRRAGELFVGLFDVWVSELLPLLDEAEGFRGEVVRGGLLDSVPVELRERWQQVGRPIVLPVSLDFASLLQRFCDASLDARGDGFRDVGNRETGRTDEARLLPSVVADRRWVNRLARVHSGDVPTTAVNAAPPRPAGTRP